MYLAACIPGVGFIFLCTCYQGQNVWKAPCIMLFTKLIFEKPKIFIHIFCLLGLSAQLNILLHLYLPSPNIDYQGVCRAGVNSYLKILTHVFLATVGINFFQLSFLYVIGSYIFHFNIIIGRGCLSYDTASCQSNKRKMVDAIETYTICVFVLVSLSSFCCQFLFWDPSCRRSIITLYFFRV